MSQRDKQNKSYGMPLISGDKERSKQLELKEKQIKKGLASEARKRIQLDARNNPVSLNIKVAPNSIIIPGSYVSEHNKVNGQFIGKKAQEDINDEMDEQLKKPFPVVAYDPSLAGYFTEGEINYIVY